MTRAGHMYGRLTEAVALGGTPRSVYSQDTTLSRRGLLTRADRRARELAAMGVQAGDLVALSMGNVVDLLVLLLATSKLGAAAAVVDPSGGDRSLLDLTARRAVRVVLRRPRGQSGPASARPPGPTTGGALWYGADYQVTSRRRLASSLLSVDVLQPPQDRAPLPAGTELVIEARGIGGVVRDIAMDGASLAAAGAASASALELDEGVRVLSAQPLTVPRFFIPVVLGWLASGAQLVMAEGPVLPIVLPLARAHERLVVVDSVRRFIEMARALKAGGITAPLRPVILQPTAPIGLGRVLTDAFGDCGQQLLFLEELGVLASRALRRGATFGPADGVRLAAGAPMHVGGHEVLAQPRHGSDALPPIPATHPGAVADGALRHTGYAGRFTKSGALGEILGRDDGLVVLEGRRACLDQIESVLVMHRRLTWVRAFVQLTPDGDPEVHAEFRATGQTPLDDLEELAIGQLPPHMVPRTLTRVD